MSKLKPIAVVDTNVFVDLHSCHDLVNEINARDATGIEHAQTVYRRARARESLLLAMYFHTRGIATYSLPVEPVTMLLKQSPPAAVAGTSITSDFTTEFIHFVRPYVLSDWVIDDTERVPVVEDPAGDMVIDETGAPIGTAADTALLAYAKDHGLPLITNEGYTRDGVEDKKLRRRAKDAGVAVFTPREYWQGKLDEDYTARAFLHRFVQRAPEYFEERRARLGGTRDAITEVFGMVESVYRHMLLGDTEGQAQVRVSVRK